MPPLVLLATDAERPALDVDDRDLPGALAALGVPSRPAVWDDGAVDWAAAELVVVRSTWDYVWRAEAYRDWTRRVAGVTRLANDAVTVAWNTHKRYLLDLAAAGVPVVPTRVLPRGRSVSLAAELAATGWSRAVVKPAESSGARDTAVVVAGDAGRHQPWLDRLLAGRDVLVQPYVDEVDEHGETSLVYLGESYSHAVSRPAALSQGHAAAVAATTACTPTSAERHVADAALAALARLLPSAPNPLYARVDLVRRADGSAVLLELEVTEPRLFLTCSAGAAGRFAAAIRDRLVAGGPGR